MKLRVAAAAGGGAQVIKQIRYGNSTFSNLKIRRAIIYLPAKICR